MQGQSVGFSGGLAFFGFIHQANLTLCAGAWFWDGWMDVLLYINLLCLFYAFFVHICV